jgi:hypothetical protein
MKHRVELVPAVFLAIITLGVTGAPSRTVLAGNARADMVTAAEHFIALLDREQTDKALYEFQDTSRFDWHFVPRERTGLPFRDMTPEQREAGHALLRSTLSAAGYLKATRIMHLEQILGILENRPERRDPEAYFFWIFGTPSASQPWGWRFEGHHLSMNFTSVTDSLIVTTPTFLGANPATVPSGPFAGTRFLGAEEDLARALVLSLNGRQRARAMISQEAPRDIITGADRTVSLQTMEGLPASEMTETQRAQLRRVILEYVGNMEHDIAHRQLAKLEAAGMERLHFGWAGSLEPGLGHYYRIHGPTVLIEYDNTQNDANHVHSVWRDLTDDFGGDLLRQHYERAGHHR